MVRQRCSSPTTGGPLPRLCLSRDTASGGSWPTTASNTDAPYYPQTNGKVEAVIKTVEREFLRLLGWCKGEACHWRWSEIKAEARSFQGWYNFYRGHGALGYRVPAALYAGNSLDKQGLENVFGLLPESAVVVEDLPVITQANRMDRLSLALAV